MTILIVQESLSDDEKNKKEENEKKMKNLWTKNYRPQENSS